MNDLKPTIDILHEGGVIAYPTEAVFGLGCDPFNETAVLRLLAIKQRPLEKGLILIAAEPSQFEPFIDPSVFEQYPQVTASWPGPHTWLLPCKPDTPLWLRGIHDSLAVRVTAHALSAALCRAFGKPLVSTSANPNGYEAARTATEVKAMFSDNQLDMIVEGEIGGLPTVSAIRDARTGKQIR